jgi:hypothetical protein
MSLPMSKRATMVAGVAVVTMVASVGATLTGAVRPVRSRAGRFYRAPSRVTWTAPRPLAGGPPAWAVPGSGMPRTMAEEIAIISSLDFEDQKQAEVAVVQSAVVQ